MATDIPVNLTANFDGRVNPLYPSGDKPSGFTPVIYKDFTEGLVGGSAQAEFDDGASMAIYADANPLSGNYINSTAVTGSSNTFNFGGWLTLPSPLVQGDEIWMQTTIRPEDDFWASSSPHLKFLRLREETALGANSGYNDVYMQTDGNIKAIKEGVNQWSYARADGVITSEPANVGAATVEVWNKYEFYIKLHSDATQGIIRVWKDNVLILEATTKTLNNSDGKCPQFLLFTYWNGEPTLPASNKTVGIDNIIIATNSSAPINTDSSGNIFIGDYL